MKPFFPKVAAMALAAAAHGASAHDTWFAPLPAGDARGVALALGTGNRFPVHESGIDMKYLVSSGCRHDRGSAPLALQRIADAPTALNVRVRADRGLPLSCWAQTSAFEVELTDDKIALYFKEIQASPEVRDAWARLRARGVRWKERYTKHARIELNPASAAVPVDMAMDVLLESPERTPRRGESMQFRVLRDGQPLADFPVELRGDRVALGIWRKTDAEGRVRFPAPLPGRWVLRGTDLRPSAREPDSWESRFVTLAFEIDDDRTDARPQADGTNHDWHQAGSIDHGRHQPGQSDHGRRQAGQSDRSNARSTNHTAATSAIAAEPPTITARR